MKTNEPLRPLAETPIRPDARTDEAIARGGWPSDRPLPAVMTDAQLRLLLQVSAATFYRMKAAGRFTRFLTNPQLSRRHARYSGALVRAYVEAQGSGHRWSLVRGARRA